MLNCVEITHDIAVNGGEGTFTPSPPFRHQFNPLP